VALPRPQAERGRREGKAQRALLVLPGEAQVKRDVALVVDEDRQRLPGGDPAAAQIDAEAAEGQHAQGHLHVDRLGGPRLAAHPDGEGVVARRGIRPAQRLEAEHQVGFLARFQCGLYPLQAHPVARDAVDLDEVAIRLIAQVVDDQPAQDEHARRDRLVKADQLHLAGGHLVGDALRGLVKQGVGLAGIDGVEDQAQLADLDLLAALQGVWFIGGEPLAVDVRAVDRAEILQEYLAIAQGDGGMVAGDRRGFQREVIARRAADGHGRLAQLVAFHRPIGPVDIQPAIGRHAACSRLAPMKVYCSQRAGQRQSCRAARS